MSIVSELIVDKKNFKKIEEKKVNFLANANSS